MQKNSRYTLGEKIDLIFVETIELVFIAGYASKENKSARLKEATSKLDLLKFLIQVAWEVGTIGTKQYIIVSEKLDEIGKMLGGWLRRTTMN